MSSAIHCRAPSRAPRCPTSIPCTTSMNAASSASSPTSAPRRPRLHHAGRRRRRHPHAGPPVEAWPAAGIHHAVERAPVARRRMSRTASSPPTRFPGRPQAAAEISGTGPPCLGHRGPRHRSQPPCQPAAEDRSPAAVAPRAEDLQGPFAERPSLRRKPRAAEAVPGRTCRPPMPTPWPAPACRRPADSHSLIGLGPPPGTFPCRACQAGGPNSSSGGRPPSLEKVTARRRI